MPRYPARTRWTNCTELARRIKAELPVQRVFTYYGFPPNRSGYVLCPFHAEKTPSLKLFTGDKPGWKCFGCGEGGSVVDFVSKLFGIPFPQAVLRLCTDFGLRTEVGPPVPARRQEIRELEKARRQEAERKAAAEEALARLSAEYRYWWEVRKYFAPDGEEELRPIFCEALRRLPELEWRLDALENEMSR